MCRPERSPSRAAPRSTTTSGRSARGPGRSRRKRLHERRTTMPTVQMAARRALMVPPRPAVSDNRVRPTEETRTVSGLKKTTEKNLMVFSGRAHPELAESVADELGTTLVPTSAYEFANSEIYIRYEESVRG